jgi:hypothetical protein
MSSPGGADDAQPPLSENPEYGPDERALSQAAARLLRPRRSFLRPVIAFGILALLVAIGVSRFGAVDQLKSHPQNGDPLPPKQPEPPQPELPAEPAEPFKSLVLDAARSYLETGNLPRPMPAAKKEMP